MERPESRGQNRLAIQVQSHVLGPHADRRGAKVLHDDVQTEMRPYVAW